MSVVEVAAAIIQRPDGAILFGQRAPGTFYPGYWEFPGGKVEPGETPHQALVRELAEELEIEVLRATPWLSRRHTYAHAQVHLHFFRVSEWRGEVRDHVHAALSWQRIETLDLAPLLPANGPVLAALALPTWYAITHAHKIGVPAQLAALDAALVKGLRLVQLREAALPEELRAAFYREAIARCHAAGARCLVNGEDVHGVQGAQGADGLHLTAAALLRAKTRPDHALVAASCHTRDELEHAAQLGLDFAVLGPVQTTPSHPGCLSLGWEKFSALTHDLPLPVFALGGLTRADFDAAQTAGAHGIAAIRSTWDHS